MGDFFNSRRGVVCLEVGLVMRAVKWEQQQIYLKAAAPTFIVHLTLKNNPATNLLFPPCAYKIYLQPFDVFIYKRFSSPTSVRA